MSHYFSERSSYGKLRVKYFDVVVRGIYLRIVSTPGVFSSSHIDSGTLLLAENMVVRDGVLALDLGCGYGILGILYAKLCPNSTVYMVDINENAIYLAKMNARLNDVKNVKIKKSNLYSSIDDLKFDVVICNPPISAGMNLNIRLIEETYKHLNDGGIFQVVYPLKMSDRFYNILKQYFKDVEVLARSGTHKAFIAYR